MYELHLKFNPVNSHRPNLQESNWDILRTFLFILLHVLTSLHIRMIPSHLFKGIFLHFGNYACSILGVRQEDWFTNLFGKYETTACYWFTQLSIKTRNKRNQPVWALHRMKETKSDLPASLSSLIHTLYLVCFIHTKLDASKLS